MNLYETIFIVRQDATPNQVEALAQEYAKVIRDHGGEIGKTEFCGLRTLAYKIKKNGKGHYVLMNVTSDPKGVTEMERLMGLNENVLRYLSIRVEKHEPNPSPLMQQRNYQANKAARFEDEQDDFMEGEEA